MDDKQLDSLSSSTRSTSTRPLTLFPTCSSANLDRTSDSQIARAEREHAAQRKRDEEANDAVMRDSTRRRYRICASTDSDDQSTHSGFGHKVRLHAKLMRVRSGDGQKVTDMELFFDLVYVYAISVISDTMVEHLVWQTVLEMLVVTLAVWWAWIYTTWTTNWLNPDSYLVRLLLIAVMLTSLILSAVIPEAFGGQSMLFACMFVFIQVGRTCVVITCLHGHRLQINFIRILAWEVVASICWIVGAAVGGTPRNIIWAVALLFDYISPLTGFYTPGLGRSITLDWTIHGGHIAERCSLFIIIALGESIVVTGESFRKALYEPAGVGAFFIAFLGSASMWWIYFHSSSTEATEYVENSEDPGRMGRMGYTYIHCVMVIGIVWCAVADRLSIDEPHLIPAHEHRMTDVAIMIGGPAIFVLGHALFRLTFSPKIPYAHICSVVVLICLTPMAIHIPLWGTALVTTAILLALSIYETYWRCMIVHGPIFQC
ncbi:LtrA-domain-containing protein [Basidiobolus meristosporus CBS 931.73]|uniref:LtrA-domain-containing protein n=1 Tax=Basidiobolus meristosporus CBS 931.73 TaxID=1314790 RepID=A0A1Y1XXK2_9FUNG|nr:LtrA-domain-containing protein [Basidiobolus meristosporus CBS 931.73]|eukprot:ORX90472.1 LtrA-domain-containing protein [Basidiobolus meristosporus CBS 931.73]